MFWLNSKSIIFLHYILPNVYFSVNKTEQEGNIRAILLVQLSALVSPQVLIVRTSMTNLSRCSLQIKNFFASSQ